MKEQTWITDGNGNKCSAEYFGSQEKAQKALDSLKNCKDCTNCSSCSSCSDCSSCSGCSGCSSCYDCSSCSSCSSCSDCSGCSSCSSCSRKKDTKGTADRFTPPVVPVIDGIHRKVYEAVTAPDNHLAMDTWHTCETTHCRGGWVVTLAGEEGKKLEAFHGTLLAAQLIYDASDTSTKFNPCRFFDTDEAAMADIKKMAGVSNG